MTDRLYKVRTGIQEFLRPEDKQVQANDALRSREYDFYGLMSFVGRIGFDMRQIANKPGKTTPEKVTPTPPRIEEEYKDLCDLYNAARDNRPTLRKADVFELF